MFMRTRFKGLAALAVVLLIAGVATPSASASRPRGTFAPTFVSHQIMRIRLRTR
jgi:hypothetical protein